MEASIANSISGVLYITTLHAGQSQKLLESALDVFLGMIEDDDAKALYKLYYEQAQEIRSNGVAFDASLDLAFNDGVLDDVEMQWMDIMGDQAAQSAFLKFQDREGADAEDVNEEY